MISQGIPLRGVNLKNTSMDKIIILAAGLGTRMQHDDCATKLHREQAAAADTGLKAFIPIDRPFLDYVLTAVADAGYRRVCLVIGPTHQQLRQYYSQQSGGRLWFEFALQPQPLGTADALQCAADFAGQDPVAMINSDNYYPASALRSLRDLDDNGLVAFSVDALVRHGNIEVSRAASYATLQCNAEGLLEQIREKPALTAGAALAGTELVSMNCWRFGPAIFQACRSIARSARGEYEIADAVIYSMRHLAQQYRVVISHEAVLDLSYRRDIETVAARLREKEVRL